VLVLGVVLDARWPAIVGVGAAAFIAGQLTTTEIPTLQIYDVGFWAMEITAFVALALCLTAAFWPDDARAGAAAGVAGPVAAARPPAPPPAPAAAAPVLPSEPGWYPDPQGGAGLRLWSGTRWTDETRG